MSKLVDKEVLRIYYKYDEDLSLLHEPWAKKEDRSSVSSEQARILGMYIDKLHLLNVEHLSLELRSKTLDELTELEKDIELEVIKELKKKIAS